MELHILLFNAILLIHLKSTETIINKRTIISNLYSILDILLMFQYDGSV